MSPQSNKNTFFGIKVSIPGINVNQATDKQLVYKNDYSTETWYALGDKSLQIGQIGSASSPSYGMNVFNNSGGLSLTLGEFASNAYGMLGYNGTTPQTLQGMRLANANNGLIANEQGFFVAKSGYDVTQATDAEMIFNSNQDVFKIIDKVSISTSINYVYGTSSTYFNSTSVAHGLTFLPSYNAFITIPTAIANLTNTTSVSNISNPALGIILLNNQPAIVWIAQVGVNSTDIVLYFQIGSQSTLANGTYTIDAVVYLLQETAN